MSFLSSVLSSIETGKPDSITPPPPPRSPGQRIQPTETKRDGQKSLPSASERTAIPVRDGTVPTIGGKRKAADELPPPEKSKTKPIDKPSSLTSAAKSPRVVKPPAPSGTSTPKPSASVTPSKAPPKGSYADLMMKAKALQEQKPLQVGLLKHQAVPKEKLSKAEKKKRALEAIAKEKAARLERRKGAISGSGTTKLGAKDSTVLKRREPEENAYKGTARPTPSSYKGTANRPSRHGGDDRHTRGDSRRNPPSRRDEYLATDEEDEGDGYGNDYDDYYSDESSDMEAGLEDVEREEQAALLAAKQEDEEDIRAEMLAKKEKIERKQKLAALAARKR